MSEQQIADKKSLSATGTEAFNLESAASYQNPEHMAHLSAVNLLPHMQRINVLIVEDDITMQPLWEHILVSINPNVSIRWSKSEEGAEIIMNRKIINDQEFDLIIVDIYLSGLKTGIDLWERYRFCDSLFLFTSSMSVKEFTEKLIKYDDEYIPFYMKKPIKKEVAVETIKAMLAFKKFLIYKGH
ncbi:MAG: hypothetical protein ACK41T_02830 [Pseudobdellovibrio sp.]